MTERTLALLQLLRLPAIFTTWSNILAAHLIATAGHPRWGTLSLLLAASSALYLGGMVLNDCFDLEEDRRERPGRPLPSGRIGIRTAWLAGWGLLLLGLLLAAAAGPAPLLVALPLTLAIVAYDGWLKRGPLGPVAMGLCRYLNWILGLSVAPLVPASWLLPLPVLIYIWSVTTLSRMETGAAERRLLALCIGGTLAAALGLLLLVLGGILPGHLAIPPLLLLTALLLWRQASLFRDPAPARVQGTVKLMLFGVIPLDALLLLAAGHGWSALLLPLLLIPGRRLARIVYIT